MGTLEINDLQLTTIRHGLYITREWITDEVE